MSDATHPAPEPEHIGLLDVDEQVDEVVLRAGDGDDLGPYPPGTFRKIVSGMVTLALLIASTYLVEGLHWARPWVPGEEPMLFWNLLGRELLGEGEEVQEAAERVELAERMASEVIDRVDEGPLPVRPVIEPPRPAPSFRPTSPTPTTPRRCRARWSCPTPPPSTPSMPSSRAPGRATPAPSPA